MSMIARFQCDKCRQEFILLQGMEMGDVRDDTLTGSGLTMSEDNLSGLSQKRTSVAVIDFINSLELHRENCDGNVVYRKE